MKINKNIVVILLLLLGLTGMTNAQDKAISIEADNFSLDGNQKIVNAVGNVVVLQKDVQVTGKKAEYEQGEQEVTIWQNVKMTYKNVVMTCDRIIVDGEEEILYAKDNIVCLFEDIKGTAKNAVFYSIEEKIVLSGNTVVQQGSDFVRGEEITIYLKNKKIISTGRTRIKLSVDKFK